MNASTNWSSGSVQAAGGRQRSITSSRLSAVSWTAVACPQSYWQFSHDRSKRQKSTKGLGMKLSARRLSLTYIVNETQMHELV